MLCSLAVSDLLVGLIAQPLYMSLQTTEDLYVQKVSVMMGYSLCGISLITITVITVDRFLALHYHMRYVTLVSESRVKYSLIIIWLISFLASVIAFWDARFRWVTVGSIIIICLIISTFSYIRIYRIVRRHQLHINTQQQAVHSSDTENNLNIARLKRSAMSTFVFYIALIICYFPMYVLLALLGLSVKDLQTEWEFFYTAVFMNSSINPFLYCWRLRTAVVKTARQMLCKQTEQN